MTEGRVIETESRPAALIPFSAAVDVISDVALNCVDDEIILDESVPFNGVVDRELALELATGMMMIEESPSTFEESAAVATPSSPDSRTNRLATTKSQSQLVRLIFCDSANVAVEAVEKGTEGALASLR